MKLQISVEDVKRIKQVERLNQSRYISNNIKRERHLGPNSVQDLFIYDEETNKNPIRQPLKCAAYIVQRCIDPLNADNLNEGKPHFVGKSGVKYYYHLIGMFIRDHKQPPWLKGMTDHQAGLAGLPALEQLDRIGLRDEFDGGYTPHQIPASFV